MLFKEAIQSSSSWPFIANFNLFVNAKTLTDFTLYLKLLFHFTYLPFLFISLTRTLPGSNQMYFLWINNLSQARSRKIAFSFIAESFITGSPSSKYKHRRASALLRNIQNIRICMGKKTYRFSNLRKWKDFNKKQLTSLKMCAKSLRIQRENRLHKNPQIKTAINRPVNHTFRAWATCGFIELKIYQ